MEETVKVAFMHYGTVCIIMEGAFIKQKIKDK